MNLPSNQNASESHDKAEPESFWTSWLAVISVSLGSFVLVTSEFLPIGLLTQIASSLHVSNGTAGLMVTVPGIVAAFAAPLMTICAGHVDRRTLVLTFIALLVGSNAMSALSSNFTMMLVSRVLFGISLGGFWTIAVTLGNRLVPKSQMARATTLILGGVSLATVLGVPAGTVIAGYAGWRASFAAIGGAALVAGLTQVFVLPRLPAPPSAGIRQLTDSISHTDVRLGLATVACVIAGHFGAYTYVTPFLRQNPGVTPGLISSVLLGYGVAGVFGNFIGGAAAARHLRYTITSVVILLAGSILLLPFFHQSLAGAIAMILIWGLAFGGMPISLNLWVFKAAPEALEGGAAMLISTFQVFIALGSILGGRIVDNIGTSAVMWASGASILMGLVFIMLSKHPDQPFDDSTEEEEAIPCSCPGD